MTAVLICALFPLTIIKLYDACNHLLGVAAQLVLACMQIVHQAMKAIMLCNCVFDGTILKRNCARARVQLFKCQRFNSENGFCM